MEYLLSVDVVFLPKKMINKWSKHSFYQLEVHMIYRSNPVQPTEDDLWSCQEASVSKDTKTYQTKKTGTKQSKIQTTGLKLPKELDLH